MKLLQLELISKKLITSYGHLNLAHQEEDTVPRDILSTLEEIGEIEKNLLMILLKACSDLNSVEKFI